MKRELIENIIKIGKDIYHINWECSKCTPDSHADVVKSIKWVREIKHLSLDKRIEFKQYDPSNIWLIEKIKDNEYKITHPQQVLNEVFDEFCNEINRLDLFLTYKIHYFVTDTGVQIETPYYINSTTSDEQCKFWSLEDVRSVVWLGTLGLYNGEHSPRKRLIKDLHEVWNNCIKK